MKTLLRKFRTLFFILKAYLRSGSLHRYEYAIGTTDETAPANVVRMVGNGRKVLDIGAGPGSITQVLIQQNQCQVTAIEIDDSAIEKLEKFCPRVLKVDLNSANWPDTLSKEAPFEVVVISDVLEHLFDPWTALAAARNLLTPDGFLVVSLPHVGHNAIVAGLLNEDFEYRDWGLLDRTHIRFFGIRNIQQLFQGAGLRIIETRFVVRTPEDTEFSAQWNALTDEIRSALTRNPFGNVYQVVVKAVAAHGPDSGLDLISMPANSSPSS